MRETESRYQSFLSHTQLKLEPIVSNIEKETSAT
jgi:hypothetical protein